LSKRTKWLLSIGVIATLVVGWQVAAFSVTGSNFQSADGNLAPNLPANATGIDWNTFATGGALVWGPSSATTNTRQATATHAASGYKFTGVEDPASTPKDTAFDSAKQDDECADVGVGKAPPKDDLKRIYLASKTDATTGSPTFGHTFLNLAWVRIDQTGNPDAHIGFEFNQANIEDDPDLACGGGSPLVERLPGDILFVYDFAGGTSTPVITVREWFEDTTDPDFEGCEVDANSVPCWGESVNLSTAGFADALTNRSTPVTDLLTPPALGANPGTSVSSLLGESEFGEAGIDLTAADIIPAGSCKSFGNAFGVSRSSGESENAAMKDLVGPANVNLGNCGEITIFKRTNPRDLAQNFSFTSTIAGGELECSQDPGTRPDVSSPFTLNDGLPTDDPETEEIEYEGDTASNTQHCTNVPTRQYTVTEGTDPDGFTFNNVTCPTQSGWATASVNGRVATINMVPKGAVTCIYTNDQDRQSTLNTAQRFIPQDTATITGVGLAFNGTVDFKLYQGTLGDEPNESCETPQDPVVYQEDNVAVAGTPKTASTNNDGTPSSAGATDGFTIDDTNDGPYYWKVFYDGPAGGDPDVTSCNENSTASINNGSGVSNPPSL
jgi:hypothetical protein